MNSLSLEDPFNYADIFHGSDHLESRKGDWNVACYGIWTPRSEKTEKSQKSLVRAVSQHMTYKRLPQLLQLQPGRILLS